MESADGHVMGVPGELTIVANSQLTDKPITRYNLYNQSTRFNYNSWITRFNFDL